MKLVSSIIVSAPRGAEKNPNRMVIAKTLYQRNHGSRHPKQNVFKMCKGLWVIYHDLSTFSTKTWIMGGCLVVSTHLKNISQNGNLPQIGMKIKNVWNHHLGGILWVVYSQKPWTKNPIHLGSIHLGYHQPTWALTVLERLKSWDKISQGAGDLGANGWEWPGGEGRFLGRLVVQVMASQPGWFRYPHDK